MSCLITIPTSQITNDAYTLEFTITPSDVTAMTPGVTDPVAVINNFKDQISNMTLFGNQPNSTFPANQTIYTVAATATPTGLNLNTDIIVPPNCSLSASNGGGVWIFLATFASWFGFSPSRYCNVEYTPISNEIKVKFTILPPNGPANTTNGAYNNLSAKCIGKWLIAFLTQYNASNLSTSPPAFVNSTKGSATINCDGFSSEIYANESYANNNITIPSFLSQIKFIRIEGYEGYNLNEKYTGVSGNSGSTIASKPPSTIWEYLFQFSFFVSFIGAIFFALTSLINIDPSSIIVNKNISFALNIFISISSIISMFVWFNMNNPILGSTALDPRTVKPRT